MRFVYAHNNKCIIIYENHKFIGHNIYYIIGN